MENHMQSLKLALSFTIFPKLPQDLQSYILDPTKLRTVFAILQIQVAFFLLLCSKHTWFSLFLEFQTYHLSKAHWNLTSSKRLLVFPPPFFLTIPKLYYIFITVSHDWLFTWLTLLIHYNSWGRIFTAYHRHLKDFLDWIEFQLVLVYLCIYLFVMYFFGICLLSG